MYKERFKKILIGIALVLVFSFTTNSSLFNNGFIDKGSKYQPETLKLI